MHCLSRSLSPLLVSGILLAACSTTRVVKSGEPFVIEQPATVRLRGGETLAVRSARLDADTLKVLPKSSDDLAAIPLSRVERVETSNAGAGALAGLLVGAGLGALVGNAMAGGGGEWHEEDSDPYADEAAGAGTVIGAVFGGVAGLALGVSGSRTTHVFEGAAAEPDSVSGSGIEPEAAGQSDASR